MRLTATEQDRLLTYTAATFAREALARGHRLSAPEAVAVIADEVHWAARAGADYAQAARAGHAALRRDQVQDGVADLLDEVRVEPLFEEGTRLVVLRWPLGAPDGAGDLSPAAAVGPIPDPPGRRVLVEVVNTSKHVVRVSSHHPFVLVNRRLVFDRDAARGCRLDLPAGSTMRWAPGQCRVVTLVEIDGTGER
jgi:urease subunit gamma/beta